MRRDRITIDTNVFVHLFTAMNHDGHIDALLEKVSGATPDICCDDGNAIFGEYSAKLYDIILANKQVKARMEILGYFLHKAKKYKCEVRLDTEYGKCISVSMDAAKAETRDKKFVFVAAVADSLCISNNDSHITNLENDLVMCAKDHLMTSPSYCRSIEALNVYDQA